MKKDLPRRKVIILGGGPNRIGQGIEFDYCCVHASMALRELGYESIMMNSNPETVSTDYDISDRLYFEPLTMEDVLAVVDREKPCGVIVQFGGQTPLNLALGLERAGVPIMGTSPDSIDLAEDRRRFGKLLQRINIPQPNHGTAFSFSEAKKVTDMIGYPVMVRPSYVLGGRAMEIVYDEDSLGTYIHRAAKVSPEHPVLIDEFLSDAVEVDVDCVADGHDVYIAGIMEHIEEAGIHSGDSACSLPAYSLSHRELAAIRLYTKKLAKELKVVGLMNIQSAIREGHVYVLEANPRASRTVPFVSKAIGVPLAKVAVKVMTGIRLNDMRLPDTAACIKHTAVKEAVFPFLRFAGVDTVLGPEMKSTGEVMGIDRDFGMAFAKAQLAAGTRLPVEGKIFVSVNDRDKTKILPIARKLAEMGFSIIATKGTARFLVSRGINVPEVPKIGEGRPDIVDIIKNGEVNLIINTPTGKKARSDGFAIRRSGYQHAVCVVTKLFGAEAVVEGIQALKKRKITVKSLQSYHHDI